MLETTKLNIEELSLIKEQLKSENLEQIDFDKLITQLAMVQSLYEKNQKTDDQFQILKQNLIQKITTMQNAILVVTKKRPVKNLLDHNLEELSTLSSQELLLMHDKTESKFHAAFPSTFKIQPKDTIQTKNYKSYK